MRHKERTGGDGRVGCVMCIPMKYSQNRGKQLLQGKVLDIEVGWVLCERGRGREETAQW